MKILRADVYIGADKLLTSESSSLAPIQTGPAPAIALRGWSTVLVGSPWN